MIVDDKCKLVPLIFDVTLKSEDPAAMPDILGAIRAKTGAVYYLPAHSDSSGTRIATPIEMSSFPKTGESWSEWGRSQFTLDVYKAIGERGHGWSVQATEIKPDRDEIRIGLGGKTVIFGIQVIDEEHYSPSCSTCIAGRNSLRFDLDMINDAIVATVSNKPGYIQYGGKYLTPHPDQKLVFIEGGATDDVGLWAQFEAYYQNRIQGVLEISSIRELRLHRRV